MKQQAVFLDSPNGPLRQRKSIHAISEMFINTEDAAALGQAKESAAHIFSCNYAIQPPTAESMELNRLEVRRPLLLAGSGNV